MGFEGSLQLPSCQLLSHQLLSYQLLSSQLLSRLRERMPEGQVRALFATTLKKLMHSQGREPMPPKIRDILDCPKQAGLKR